MSAACSWPRVLFALALVALPGCASTHKNVDDPVEVVWFRLDDPQKTCERLSGRPEIFRILGCSKWSDSRRTCAIFAPMPRDEKDTQRMATLGHELMHCFDGNWHDRYGRMNDKNRQAALGGTTQASNRVQGRAEELRKVCEELSGRPDLQRNLGCPNAEPAAGGTKAPSRDRKEELRKTCDELADRPDFRKTLGCPK